MQNHFNPGFDIFSTNGDDERYIEVKGSKNLWEKHGVELSKTQLKMAQDRGEKYWVYVVEEALTNPKIHRIQNIFYKIDLYRIDGSWKNNSNKVQGLPVIGHIFKDKNKKGIIKDVEPRGDFLRLWIAFEGEEVIQRVLYHPDIHQIEESDD